MNQAVDQNQMALRSPQIFLATHEAEPINIGIFWQDPMVRDGMTMVSLVLVANLLVWLNGLFERRDCRSQPRQQLSHSVPNPATESQDS
jgi:hypothetical protein